MDFLDFIILGLATWRVVNYVYDDKWAGPFDILHKLRYAIGVRYGDESRRGTVAEPVWRRELADMHNCPYCMSFWYGLAASIVWVITPTAYEPVLLALALPFALSGFISITQKVQSK